MKHDKKCKFNAAIGYFICTCTPTQVEGATKKKGDCPSCMAGFSRDDFAGNCTCDYSDHPTQVPDGGWERSWVAEDTMVEAISKLDPLTIQTLTAYINKGKKEAAAAAVRQREGEILEIVKKYKCGDHKKLQALLNPPLQ